MGTPPRLLFLDAETYFDNEYSLSKMPTPNYILDPRFELQMMAVKEEAQPAKIIDGCDFPAYIKQFDPKNTVTVTFNSLFDNSILAWRYGFTPSLMIDTMGMARALLQHELSSFSLRSILEHMRLSPKGNALAKVKGLRRAEITGDLWREFSAYALGDVEGNAAIFRLLSQRFPASERRVMDLVLRCAIEPRFMIDIDMLRQHLADVRAEKALLLDRAGGDVSTLMSSDKFKAALELLGVAIQYKTSPSGKLIPAFAKTDSFMEELSNHPDARVQTLAAARLGHKSTLEETRSEKLLTIAELPWSDYLHGNSSLMPVPLRYGAAHTHRLGGEWGINLQNLPTVRGSKGKSKLRQSLIAPAGHSVLTADLRQIEARLVAWICKASILMEQFADNGDPYAKLAEKIFGYPVDRKKQIIEGFIGKTGILGLGYGCGADHFYDMCLTMARVQGIELGSLWDKKLASKSVQSYRSIHFPIPDSWRTLDDILSTAWLSPNYRPRMFGPVEISYGKITLPNGLTLDYADPQATYGDDGRRELRYRHGKTWHKIYGAKALENIVQALARVIVMNAALRIADRGFRFALQGHDELAFIIPTPLLDKAKEIIYVEMTRRPSWAPDLPLDVEIGVGKSYGEAK